MKREPVHVIRLGLLKCEITRRETSTGAFFNVKLLRMFRNGDQWKESYLFGRDDLLVGAKLLDLAHTWIFANGSMLPAEKRRTTSHEQSPTSGK
jgi:hypothetical protein